jgi:hypothetical protein
VCYITGVDRCRPAVFFYWQSSETSAGFETGIELTGRDWREIGINSPTTVLVNNLEKSRVSLFRFKKKMRNEAKKMQNKTLRANLSKTK